MTRYFSKLAAVRNRHLLISDVLLIFLGSYFSFVLRLEEATLPGYRFQWALFTGLAVLIIPITFRWLQLYSRFWRYASIEDLMPILYGIGVGAIGATFLSDLILSWTGYSLVPRSIPLIFSALAIILLILPRAALRLIGRQTGSQEIPNKPVVPVLIYGAGDAGVTLLREIQLNPRLCYEVRGFIDDDPQKAGLRILGVPVLGDRSIVDQAVQKTRVEMIMLAIPSAAGQENREIVKALESTKARVKIMPSLYELLNGNLSVSQLRDVNIEDLLRRESVSTDRVAVEQLLAGKRVLITGGGGSIGSELCRQILHARPAQMILLGHGENSVFGIFHELKRMSESLELNYEVELVPVIADTRFPNRINAIFEKHRPEVVYHAAAHKHVPLMEHNPSEAITNNVLGTRNVLDACQRVGVERFVMISTDKAVNPTNVMGASKRAAELLVHAAAEASGRPYVAVRFGNVLGSRGSVIHTFKRQIAAGGPITVTHPDISRYFMIIPEAVQLVLQASILGRGGEVFVLDMGEPVKIVDLARDLIELSGLRVGDDIEIAFSGLRPGEKLYEELFITEEDYTRTTHTKIFVADNAGALVPIDLEQRIDRLIAAAECDDVAEIGPRLTEVVPEYGAAVSE